MTPFLIIIVIGIYCDITEEDVQWCVHRRNVTDQLFVTDEPIVRQLVVTTATVVFNVVVL